MAEDRWPHLFESSGDCYIACGDGAVLELLAASVAGTPLDLGRVAKDLAVQGKPRFL
jgi:hypothetical protein